MVWRKRRSENRYEADSFRIRALRYKRISCSRLLLLEELNRTRSLKPTLVSGFVRKRKARVYADNIPVVLTILYHTSMQIAMLAMRLAIKLGYPDLEYKFDVNQRIPAAGIILLNQIDEDRLNILNGLHNDVQQAVADYARLYHLDLERLPNEFHTDEMAGYFYEFFTYESKLDEFKCLNSDLHFFISSVVDMFYFLCELVIDGKIDLSDPHDKDGNWIEQDDRDYSFYLASEVDEYKLVAGLAQRAALSLEQLTHVISIAN